MAQDMTLYWGSGSPPCWRVMIVLEEKKLQDYNSRLMSFEKRDHKGPEVMKINPKGQFPAFQDGNIIINESIGICIYLEDTFKGQGTALMPEDKAERAVVWQRTFEVNDLMQKFRAFAFYDWIVPEPERHESALKRNKEALCAEVKMWEDYVTKCNGQCLAGKNFTLADAVVFPVIAMLFRMGLCEKKYPKLADYYNHLKTRPSIEKTWPPSWKETPGKPALKDI